MYASKIGDEAGSDVITPLGIPAPTVSGACEIGERVVDGVESDGVVGAPISVVNGDAGGVGDGLCSAKADGDREEATSRSLDGLAEEALELASPEVVDELEPADCEEGGGGGPVVFVEDGRAEPAGPLEDEAGTIGDDCEREPLDWLGDVMPLPPPPPPPPPGDIVLPP